MLGKHKSMNTTCWVPSVSPACLRSQGSSLGTGYTIRGSSLEKTNSPSQQLYWFVVLHCMFGSCEIFLISLRIWPGVLFPLLSCCWDFLAVVSVMFKGTHDTWLTVVPISIPKCMLDSRLTQYLWFLLTLLVLPTTLHLHNTGAKL